MDNHIYVFSFTTGSETGLAIVTAATERDAIRVLRNSGRYNGFPDAYKILESRNLGLTTCIRTELIMESYVNAEIAFRALMTIAPVHGEKGDKGDNGDQGNPGLSAYQVAVANGYKGTEEEWLAFIKGPTMQEILNKLEEVSPNMWVRGASKYSTALRYGSQEAMGYGSVANGTTGDPGDTVRPNPQRLFNYTKSNTSFSGNKMTIKGLLNPDTFVESFPVEINTGDFIYINDRDHQYKVGVVLITSDPDAGTAVEEITLESNTQYTETVRLSGIPESGQIMVLYEGAIGYASHVEGIATTAKNPGEYAGGRYNKSTYGFGLGYSTQFSVGCGTDDNHRANALEITKDGRVYIKGVSTYNGTNVSSNDIATYLSNLTGISFVMAWRGDYTPNPAAIPSGVVVEYNGQSYTGTLAASSAKLGAFYLVKNENGEGSNVYDEYVVVEYFSSKSWEKVGSPSIAGAGVYYILAEKDGEHLTLDSSVTYEDVVAAIEDQKLIYFLISESDTATAVPATYDNGVDDTVTLSGLYGAMGFVGSIVAIISENSSNIFATPGETVTSTEKAAWSAKYDKPSGGIPSTDMSSDVQTSLGKADTALQSFTETDPTVPSWAKAQNPPTEIFWANYGTTTSTEIQTAVSAGKIVLCKVQFTTSIYATVVLIQEDDSSNWRFFSADTGTVYSATCNKNTSAWGYSRTYIEQGNNKVSTLSGNESNTTKYPNTKAVYDALPVPNPTVPSGTTPTALTGLKIGSNYYDVEAGGGTVTDVTVGGTSVVNGSGVAVVPAIPTVEALTTSEIDTIIAAVV